MKLKSLLWTVMGIALVVGLIALVLNSFGVFDFTGAYRVTLSPAQPLAVHPAGLTIRLEDLSGPVPVEMSALEADDAGAQDVPISDVPVGLAPLGVIYRIGTDVPRGVHGTVSVAVPAGGEIRTLALYASYGGGEWQLLPFRHDPTEAALKAEIDRLPVELMVAEVTYPPSIRLMALAEGDERLDEDTFDMVEALLPIGWFAEADGSLSGALPAGLDGYDGAVMPVVSNRRGGGIGLSEFGNRQLRLTHMADLVGQVRVGGFDGVVLDYEVEADQTEGLSILVASLAAELHADGLSLGVIVNGTGLGAYDLGVIGREADFVLLRPTQNPLDYVEGGLAHYQVQALVGSVERSRAGLLISALCVDVSESESETVGYREALSHLGPVSPLSENLLAGGPLAVNETFAIGLTGGAGPLTVDERFGITRFNYSEDGETHTVWLSSPALLSLPISLAREYRLGLIGIADLFDPDTPPGIRAHLDAALEGVTSQYAHTLAWRVESESGAMIDMAPGDALYTGALTEPGSYRVEAVVESDYGEVQLGSVDVVVIEATASLPTVSPEPIATPTPAPSTYGGFGKGMPARLRPDTTPTPDVTATVNNETLNVRAGPGTGYPIIGVLHQGDTVPVIGRNVTGSWLQIEYDGGPGWVATYLVTVTGDMEALPVMTPPPTEAAPAGGTPAPPAEDSDVTAVVSGSATINVRSGPGTSFQAIGALPPGTELTVIGRNAPADWLQVEFDGHRGWVARFLLEVTGNVLNLPVTFVGEVEAPSVPVPPQPAEGGQPVIVGAGVSGATAAAVVNVESAYIRSGPGTAYQIVGGVMQGDSLTAIGRNADGSWLLIRFGGSQGWIAAWLVDITSGTLSSLPVAEGIQPTATPAPPSAVGAMPAPVIVSGAIGGGFELGGHVDSFAYPDLMHYAGMTWVKRQWRYHLGQDPGAVAGWINEAHARGFRILLSIDGDPAEMAANGGYFQAYADFVGGVAAYGADAIEVWNEQNLDREWPTGQIDPAAYTRLLAMAYNAIKAANPGVMVISGALSPTGAEGAFGTDRVWNDNRYLAGMAAAGAAQYMDCLGIHYNEGIVPPSWTSGDPRDNYYTRYFWGMINTYWSIFGGARPLCFTELGYLSPEGYGPLPGGFAWAGNVTVAQQAEWLAQAARLAASSGRVRLMIIWNVDFTGYGADPVGGYAIVRPDGSCPACDALAAARIW